ncbi:MAG: ATP-binding protein, partial [Bacteroidota bacterium]
QSANDRHSNQEIAYLLQRIEDFPGLIILATNLKGNIDEAFARRFQSMIQFTMPSAEQRLRLWKNAFAQQPPIDETVDFTAIAQDHELAGGSIINVLRYVALTVARQNLPTAQQYHLLEGIRRELRKTGQWL